VRVDQLLPVLGAHDAVGSHALAVRRALRAAGYASDLYADVVAPGLADQARPWLDGPGRISPERVVVYHASTHAPLSEWLLARGRRGERIVVDYHNITPPVFFRRWLPDAAWEMTAAREELAALAAVAEASLADSAFNAAELAGLGYRSPEVSPLLVDLDAFRAAPDPPTLARMERQRRNGGAAWLFVGRIAPNKCQHDVLAAFAVYRKLFDRRARLCLVGGVTAPTYLAALQRMVDHLDLEAAVEIVSGSTSEELSARYVGSDVVVCMSEHEGFCVPLLEAMALGVPIVAYRAAAVPETVGDAAVLLGDKEPVAVATAVADLLGDAERRAAIVEAGRARARRFGLETTSAELLGHLRRLPGSW
jgi:glycosyltransferase involved in cell wall biosynthesis